MKVEVNITGMEKVIEFMEDAKKVLKVREDRVVELEKEIEEKNRIIAELSSENLRPINNELVSSVDVAGVLSETEEIKVGDILLAMQDKDFYNCDDELVESIEKGLEYRVCKVNRFGDGEFVTLNDSIKAISWNSKFFKKIYKIKK